MLSVGKDRTEEFEAGLREHEHPIWADFHSKGTLLRASLTRMDISSRSVQGAAQYLIVAQSPTVPGITSMMPILVSMPGTSGPMSIKWPSLAIGGETFLHFG